MSYGSHNPWSVNRGEAAQTAGRDLGLRRYMLSVYNYMGLALCLTGLVAYLAASSGLYLEIARTPMIYVVIFAPLGVVLFLSTGINRISLSAAQLAFWIYAALMGLSLGFVFLAYTQTSIASTFFVTAATFLGMSLYGYTTKRDLTGMGSFMTMGLFGIIIASLVNLFLASSGLQFLITIVGVIVFTGLTAWDTQRIREQYYLTNHDAAASGKSAIMGALQLYLDFVNLFLMLLRLFGNRR